VKDIWQAGFSKLIAVLGIWYTVNITLFYAQTFTADQVLVLTYMETKKN